jgi:very-short-patch-repair endonuclease
MSPAVAIKIPSPSGRGAGVRVSAMPKSPLKNSARSLRQKMTEAECRLWFLLRDRRLTGAKFRRQYPLGRYIADFYCHEHRLILEADGGQHNKSLRDEQRDAWLASNGYRVLRFWNDDILGNQEQVLTAIVHALRAPSPGAQSASASPKGRGDESKAEIAE